MSIERIPRRRFLTRVAAATGAATWAASSRSRVLGANGRLRVAAIGVGGKGWSDHTSVAASPHVEVVALCDVDEGPEHLGKGAEHYSKSSRYTDWRRLLDEAGTFDAVTVSTPDHMHAPIALAAMALGKHVFCQKPLTHTVFEARQMRLAARKHGIVTQMGNQIQAHEAYRSAVKFVHDGGIGKVKGVHSWQSGPLNWLLVDERPPGADPVPPGLHWDDWLGDAPVRPYTKKIYHPFNWRAWQDFSNGQLGDFGCHILDPVFQALELTAPTSIQAEAPPLPGEVWTRRARVSYEFPATSRTTDRPLPLIWYDGEGHVPPREALGLPRDMGIPQAGSLLIGERGLLLIPHVAFPVLVAEGKVVPDAVPMVPASDHYLSWADACRGEARTSSSFEYSGPLTETVLLGSVAIRVPGEPLCFDAPALKITNSARAEALLRKSYRRGWEPAWVS